MEKLYAIQAHFEILWAQGSVISGMKLNWYDSSNSSLVNIVTKTTMEVQIHTGIKKVGNDTKFSREEHRKHVCLFKVF